MDDHKFHPEEKPSNASDGQVSIIVPTVFVDEKHADRKSVLMHFNDPNYPVDSKSLDDAESTHGSTYATDSLSATPVIDFDEYVQTPALQTAVLMLEQ